MALYQLSEGDMEILIESLVADEPIEDKGGELTYIEIFRFFRPLGENDWVGPYHPRPLLDQILEANGITPELIDEEGEQKTESSLDHLDIDALEEEERNCQSVDTRLNNFGD